MGKEGALAGPRPPRERLKFPVVVVVAVVEAVEVVLGAELAVLAVQLVALVVQLADLAVQVAPPGGPVATRCSA